MQLLPTCSVPNAEYACLSMLMNNSSDDIDVEPFIELTTIASPLATIPPAVCRSQLVELHNYMGTRRGDVDAQTSKINSLSVEDQSQISDQQKSNGISHSGNKNSLLALHQERLNGVSHGEKKTSLQAQHEALMNGLAMEVESELHMQRNDNDQLQMHRGCASVSPFQDLYRAEDDRYEQKYYRGRSSHHIDEDTGTCQSYCTQSGMVLIFKVIRERKMIEKCLSTFHPVLQNPKGNKSTDWNIPYEAIVLTVGISGSPFRTNFSIYLCTLRKRLEEFISMIETFETCKGYVNGSQTNKIASAQKQGLEMMLFSLLMDDESLKTNSQFDAQNDNNTHADIEMVLNTKNAPKSKLFPKKLKFAEKRRRKKGIKSEEASAKNFVSTALLSSSAPSSQIAKMISDQMQVLSLAEKNVKLRGYTKSNGLGKIERDRTSGLLKSPGNGDRERPSTSAKSPIRPSRRMGRELAGFDYVPPDIVSNFNPVPATNTFGFGSGSHSDGTSITSATVGTDYSSASGQVPTLSGPIRDSSSSKRQLRRNKVLAASMAHQHTRSWNSSAPVENGNIWKSPHSQNDGGIQMDFDPFANDDADFGKSPFSENPQNNSLTPPSASKKLPKQVSPKPIPYVPGSRKLFIALALNEDLACTYRGSKLTSCMVQGIVQLQMKSKSTAFVPFIIRVKDDKGHIGRIEENSDLANDLSNENEGDAWKHKFIVTLPKADSYYPVLQYVCSNELVPVPLRVQSKVRTNEMNCRVALQVSSNPSNEKMMSELTIVMTIPNNVSGESVSTQPEGGVWNPKKRSVMWCVKELGQGEKFILQAQFTLLRTFEESGIDPSFPIAIRCQSMSTQLSSIVMDCSDAKGFPGEVTTKIARRFRVSQREII